MAVAARCGLATPRTLITNDRAAAVDFANEIAGPVVCKTLSSTVLSEGGQARITYTTPVELTTVEPAQLAATAHLFQEWIDKRHDVRVVMVGDRAFAVAIHAGTDQAHVDWRSDYQALGYASISPPADVVAGMRRYLDQFGLAFGVFDFAVTDDGWVAYECNPAGQWLWLAEATGLPIAAAFADLLLGGTRP